MRGLTVMQRKLTLIIFIVLLISLVLNICLFWEKQRNDSMNVKELYGDTVIYIDDFPKKSKEIDDTNRIKRAIESIDGGTIVFSAKKYKISSEITINKYIRLVGQGANATIIDIIKDTNGITFKGSPEGENVADGYLQNSSIGLESMTVQGRDSYTKNAISFIYVGRANLNDIVFSHYGGNGLYLQSAQDMYISNCYFRYNGNQKLGTASVYMDNISEEASSTQNVNDIKFIGCTFEHNNGQLIKSIGSDNNSINFSSCKFEYHSIKGDSPAIYIEKGKRFQFTNSRFTSYDKSGMFYINNSSDISIEGATFNRNEPVNFAHISNSNGINVNILGKIPGKVNIQGNSYNIYKQIIDDQHNGLEKSVLDEYKTGIAVDLRNIHYPDDDAVVVDDSDGTNGASIQLQGGDYKRILYFKINDTPISNNLTFWIKARSSDSKQYEVRLKNKEKEEIIRVLDIGSKYQWYKVEIPASSLTLDSYLIMNTINNQGNTAIRVSKMYYQ
ncbi:right-handed parallel beta-helix repeat-containing protein [Niallia taxi]|uniref:right-handed parallel beta-helix repeat-containing protein n=1 Tax=Niallia taxi TaxID=2499688 RepID=UPI00300807D5